MQGAKEKCKQHLPHNRKQEDFHRSFSICFLHLVPEFDCHRRIYIASGFLSVWVSFMKFSQLHSLVSLRQTGKRDVEINLISKANNFVDFLKGIFGQENSNSYLGQENQSKYELVKV